MDPVQLKTLNPLSYDVKCTYYLETKFANGAPGFELVKADMRDFQFQWIEFDTSVMVNGAVLPSVSASPYFMGSYSSYQGTFLNPLTTAGLTGFPQQSSTFREFNDPRLAIPGQIGNYTYYPSYDGPYSTKQVSTINSEQVQI